jgi:hypothetical protein
LEEYNVPPEEGHCPRHDDGANGGLGKDHGKDRGGLRRAPRESEGEEEDEHEGAPEVPVPQRLLLGAELPVDGYQHRPQVPSGRGEVSEWVPDMLISSHAHLPIVTTSLHRVFHMLSSRVDSSGGGMEL